MKILEYKNTPNLIRSLYSQEQVLSAYASDITNNIIVWIINPSTNKQMEVEYSFSENRLLSVEERLRALPAPQRIDLRQGLLSLTKSYVIEKDSGTLYENYELRDTRNPNSLAFTSQVYHTPYRETDDRIKEKLITQVEQKILYSSMTAQQKAAYWSGRLYKQRRQIGESGRDENAIFDGNLLEEMCNFDPEVEQVLPECLRQLADMEQADYFGLVEEFQRRTGCQLL